MSTLTKVFIVLQLVFSIGLAVVVVMAVGSEKETKEKLKEYETGMLAAQAGTGQAINNKSALENQVQTSLEASRKATEDLKTALTQRTQELTQANTRLDVLQGQLTESNSIVSRSQATLSSAQERLTAREKEVEAMRPEFAKLREQNAQLVVANQQLQNSYDLAAKAVKTLQENIAEMKDKPEAATSKASASGTSAAAKILAGTQAPVEINGKVTGLRTDADKVYVTLSLGTRDKVQVDTKFMIYRDNTFVADARVQQVTPAESVAEVTMTAKGQSVQAGDLAKSGS